MTSARKPNRRAQRHARQQERERAQRLAELRAQREQAYKALGIATELGAMDVVAKAAEYVSRLDRLINALENSPYGDWTTEHLNARS
jgi:hypothetical protein